MKYCFYHKVDLDGKCSAAIVKHFVPDIELVPFNYNEEFPFDDIKEHDVIYFADTVINPFENLVAIYEKIGDGLHIIDHHSTFITSETYTYLKKKLGDNIYCETGRASCELMYGFFAGKELPVPEAIQLLGQFDCWRSDKSRMKDGDKDWEDIVLPFQLGLKMEEFDFVKFWDLVENPSLVSPVINIGRFLLKYQERQNLSIMKNSFEKVVDGYNCLCVNTNIRNSMVFKSKWEPRKHHCMVAFNLNKRKRWSWSFYTNRSDVNVADLARKYEGNGHRRAAGCYTDYLLWEKPTPIMPSKVDPDLLKQLPEEE